MDVFFCKFRTPITYFCFGVLFSTICIWANIKYRKSALTKSEVYQTKIEVNKSRKIYIAGAVNKEGNYEIQENEDILDFIEQNVGYSENVDLEMFRTKINQLSDEDSLIFVPSLCTTISNNSNQFTNNEVQQKSDLISINTASKSELENLPGIGAVYAERIIQGRPYTQLSDLKKIKGIGDKTFSKLEPYICL